MKKLLNADIVSTGLAIFSMFFGAGNLLYPLQVGIIAGEHNIVGISGFLITAMLIPLMGLIAMILFDGNYEEFFYRLGKIPGAGLIAACVLVLGPVIAIPRIVTLSHTMVSPFIPALSPFVFCLLFLGVTFLATYRESKVMTLLGNVISPLLVISLGIIIIKGLFSAHQVVPTQMEGIPLFLNSMRLGYETLDLLGAIFFSAIVINLLKKSPSAVKEGKTVHGLAIMGLKAGVIGVSLLGIIYLGMSYLGVYHGHGMAVKSGQLFSSLSIAILGSQWAIIVALAVLMACLSTAIALSVVTAEYFQYEIFKNKVSYIPCLILALVASIPLSSFGLDKILALTGGPITYIGYPVIIALTACNIAYKLFNVKPIKIPVLTTLIISLISYLW